MSIDAFLDRAYDRTSYTCLHFAAEVWQHETGEDVQDRLAAVLASLDGQEERAPFVSGHVRAFRRLATPRSPCFALMQRPGSEPHVGVYLRGRILHITPKGVEFFPPSLASRGFTSVRYYQ